MPSSEKLALFVDGLSLHHTAKALNFSIDFKRLLAEFGTRGVLVRAYYYTIIAEEFQTTRPLIDWLDYNGFTVRTNSVKEFDDGQGRRKFKRNIGIELVVDAVEINGLTRAGRRILSSPLGSKLLRIPAYTSSDVREDYKFDWRRLRCALLRRDMGSKQQHSLGGREDRAR